MMNRIKYLFSEFCHTPAPLFALVFGGLMAVAPIVTNPVPVPKYSLFAAEPAEDANFTFCCYPLPSCDPGPEVLVSTITSVMQVGSNSALVMADIAVTTVSAVYPLPLYSQIDIRDVLFVYFNAHIWLLVSFAIFAAHYEKPDTAQFLSLNILPLD